MSRWASTNDTITSVGGRAPLGHKSRRLAQNLVRPLKLPILALELLEPITLRAGDPARRPWSRSAWRTHLQRLGRASYLRRNRSDRRPLRVMFGLVLEYETNRPFSDFRGKPLRCAHNSILKKWSLRNPGAVQPLASSRTYHAVCA